MSWLFVLFAATAGALNPFQNVNAELNKHLQQPVWAAAWVYLSGFLGVMLLQAIVRQAWPGQAITSAPWWAWFGGLLSIVTTMIGLMFAQKLGSGIFTGVSISASILVSILLDHMGWIGFKQHPASPMRLAGAGLMVLGVWLVSRF
ncbi:DMT family transporter [Terriglobus aquaticus]|nr:DMT family transporter [Terriglobus aquaticus]